MALIVQKFGGTSVKSPETRKAVLKHILRAKDKGFDVVVVVSAMGRMGDPYATDTLIDLLKAQGGEICPKKKDLIMSCGEIISATIMASYIEAQGVKAEAITGFQAGIVTTADFGNADILKVNPTLITEKLQDEKVVVVAGFQGQTEKGEITTLGRGGSDTTAVVLGGYLKAELVELYTDVPGIAVTDPRIVPEAPFIPKISYDEVLAMAENGAKVIHPRAVKAAKNFNIPLRVRSTFDESDGTLVGEQASDISISGISVQKDLTVALFNGKIDAEINKLRELSRDKAVYINNLSQRGIIIDEGQRNFVKDFAEELGVKLKFCEDMAKVSVIYEETTDFEELNQDIFASLAKENVQIIGKYVCNNYTNCIVTSDNAEKSVRAIFNGFFS